MISKRYLTLGMARLPMHHGDPNWSPPKIHRIITAVYRIEGFKVGPQSGTHFAEGRQPSGQPKWDFPVWICANNWPGGKYLPREYSAYHLAEDVSVDNCSQCQGQLYGCCSTFTVAFTGYFHLRLWLSYSGRHRATPRFEVLSFFFMDSVSICIADDQTESWNFVSVEQFKI